MTTSSRWKLMVGAAAVSGALAADAAVVTVSSDITVDTTWVSTNEYMLTKPIFVRDGATLTVQAGTVIRGEKETSTDPGALIVSRGAKIRMMGTESQPIVMTTTNDNHFVGPTPTAGTPPWSTMNNGICRLWGGLLLLGRAYIATNVGEPGTPSPHPSLELQIEGLEPYGTYSKYGGGDDDDDSGEIHYVSIRYGGFVLGDANEINGLTMGAVGRGTEIDHVESFQNKDDAFEFFGSTVNTKYMVAWCDGDDGFDWDEGFRGKGQFWLRVQGPLSSEGDISDKGAEMDGGMGDSSQPSSCPTIFNATFVGTGKDSGNKKNTALHFRDGTGGRYYNSLFMDFGGACALIEGDPNDSTYDAADNTQADYVNTAFYTHHTGGSKKLEIKGCFFWKFGTNVAFGCPVNTEGLAAMWGAEHKPAASPPILDGNKAHFDVGLFTNLAFSNTYSSVTNVPVRELRRSTTPVTIGGKNYYPVEWLDPTLPDGSPLLNSGIVPPADGFFTPVKMVGAFGTRNWAGWTLASRLGLLESDTYGEYVDPKITDSFVAATIKFPTAVGANYTVQYTTNEATMAWTDLVTGISGTGAEYTYTDQRPITEPRLYRVLSSDLSP